jgi:hypothetical protein
VAESRGSRLYKRLVAEFKDQCRRARAACARCGQAIDYDAASWHPNSFQAGHIKAWDTHPELRMDPANFQPEHALCNQEAGKADVKPGIGTTSEEW